MWTLNQSSGIRGHAGNPIPTPWKAFEELGIVLRRGQLVLVVAPPGIGKSAKVLNLSLQAMLPGFIFSADSDAFTQLTRSIAILCDITVERASQMVLEGDLPEDIQETLRAIPLRIDYNSSPTPHDIEENIAAYYELTNEFPALIVVDNITNVVTDAQDSGDPFSGLEALMDYLHSMARITGACVIGLHHVTGDYNNGQKAIPLNGVKGQITRVPQLVLTLWRPSPGRLGVSVVKNRGGKADPSGELYAELEFTGENMKVTDVTYTEPNHVSIEWENNQEDDRRYQEEVFQ